MAAGICMLIGAIGEIGGAVLGLIMYFGFVATTQASCDEDGDTSITTAAEQLCIDFSTGFVGTLIFPSVGLGVIAGVICLVASIMTFKAFKSFGKTVVPSV